MIKAHGGKLINVVAEKEERDELLALTSEMISVVLGEREFSDLDMIASGALSPLSGFMNAKDYDSVVDSMHLSNGVLWSLPVTLTVSKEEAGKIKTGQNICLKKSDNGSAFAVMTVEDIYDHNKSKEAKEVYCTEDKEHPGVAALYRSGDVCLGGPVRVLNRPEYSDFNEYRLDPSETRALFEKKGWRTVVAFQTRNPLHRAHEYLQKCALEIVDGLLIHPLVGETKGDDIPAIDRVRSYEKVMKIYYPADRAAMTVFPAAMRYAGPREAVFHAICRQNYGCTHFIVGRDHAGVGNYYGTYDAHNIFGEFKAEELEITPLFFDHSFFCKTCGGMATAKTCPHGKEDRIFLSGTEVRRRLIAGEMLPPEMTRPEVSEILIWAMKGRK